MPNHLFKLSVQIAIKCIAMFGCFVLNWHFSSAQIQTETFAQLLNFNKNNGLVSDKAFCTLVDSRGYLWIGTNKGLQRFNGYEFELFEHNIKDSNSISSNSILRMYEDRSQHIWFATSNGISVYTYNTGSFKSYTTGNIKGSKKNLDEILSFFEDSKGRHWIGSISNGLFEFNSQKNEFEAVLNQNNNETFRYVNHIQETPNHELIFSVTNGFVLINLNGHQTFYAIPKPPKALMNWPITFLEQIPNYPNEIWISASFESHYSPGGKGIYCYDRNSKKWTLYVCNDTSISNNVFSKPAKLDKDTWLFGSDFICLFNHRTKEFNIESSLKKSNISGVYQTSIDKDQNIWLTTNSNGVFIFRKKNILFDKVITDPNTLGKAIIYDTTSHSYLGIQPYFTNEISIRRDTEKVSKVYPISHFIKHQKFVGTFLTLYQGNAYLATSGGLWKFNLESRKLDSLRHLNDKNIWLAYIINYVIPYEGKIYATGQGCGPLVYDIKTNQLENLSLCPEKLVSTNFMYITHDGILYTAFSNIHDTIYSINLHNGKKEKFSFPTEFKSSQDINVTSFVEDEKHRIWCGTSNHGIAILNPSTKKWEKCLTPNDDLKISPCQSLASLKNGIVWCQTSDDLYMIRANNFKYKRYVMNDGMEHRTMNAFLQAIDSSHLIVSDNGQIFTVNQQVSQSKTLEVPISIYNIKIGEMLVKDSLFLLDTIRLNLSPNQNYFSLSYAAISIFDEKELNYTYYLEGVDERIKTVGKAHSLSYNNLSPGTYYLHIHASNNDESIIAKEKIIQLIVHPAWYQTLAFRIILIAFIALILFAFIRFYIRRKIQLEQINLEKQLALSIERSRIATDMHDDLGAGISRIRYISQTLKKQLEDPDILNHFNQIIDTSDELVGKMNEIIWALDSGDQILEDILYFIRSQTSEMLDSAGINTTTSIPDNLPRIMIQGAMKRNLYLLIKEAVHNIIKHSKASEASISYRYFNDELQIEIRDNGIGISNEKKNKHGHGLTNFSSRVNSMNGKLDIYSNDQGTTIQVKIPIS